MVRETFTMAGDKARNKSTINNTALDFKKIKLKYDVKILFALK